MRFVRGPELVVNPSGRAPLAAELRFATDAPSRAAVEVEVDGGRRWRVPTESGSATEHAVAVLGMPPERRALVRVSASDGAGATVEAQPLELCTGALPDGFPPLEIRRCEASRRAPGVSFFIVRPGARRDPPPECPFTGIVAVDEGGAVVWVYDARGGALDVRVSARGTLLYTGDNAVTEIDMLGRILGRWHAAGAYPDGLEGSKPVDVPAIHHSVRELPDGHLLATAIELRRIEDFPASDADPQGPRAPVAPSQVVGDLIVELTREGSVVGTRSLLDTLDPCRIAYGAFGPYWGQRGFPDARDWSHCNGIALDPRDGSILLSLRTQDAVIKIDRATGALRWILGPHENWRAPWAEKLLTPAGPLGWQFHQHDPSITERGTVLLFDNGTGRASPPAPRRPAAENYSRVVEFTVDEAARTVREAWSFGGPDAGLPYATYVSGAFDLPASGTVLANFAGVVRDDSGRPMDVNTQGHGSVHIYEVTRTAAPEILFHLAIDTQAEGDPVGWSSFRIEHAPSLYFAK